MDIKTKKTKMFSMYALYLLPLLLLPMTASAYSLCAGKSFRCHDSTHFMICVDIGNGISIALENFVVQCPPGTECHDSNPYQCHMLQSTTLSTSEVTNDMLRLVSAEVTVPTQNEQDNHLETSTTIQTATSSVPVTSTITPQDVTLNTIGAAPDFDLSINNRLETTTENYKLLSDTTTWVYVKEPSINNQMENSLDLIDLPTNAPETERSTTQRISETVNEAESTIGDYLTDYPVYIRSEPDTSIKTASFDVVSADLLTTLKTEASTSDEVKISTENFYTEFTTENVILTTLFPNTFKGKTETEELNTDIAQKTTIVNAIVNTENFDQTAIEHEIKTITGKVPTTLINVFTTLNHNIFIAEDTYTTFKDTFDQTTTLITPTIYDTNAYTTDNTNTKHTNAETTDSTSEKTFTVHNGFGDITSDTKIPNLDNKLNSETIENDFSISLPNEMFITKETTDKLFRESPTNDYRVSTTGAWTTQDSSHAKPYTEASTINMFDFTTPTDIFTGPFDSNKVTNENLNTILSLENNLEITQTTKSLLDVIKEPSTNSYEIFTKDIPTISEDLTSTESYIDYNIISTATDNLSWNTLLATESSLANIMPSTNTNTEDTLPMKEFATTISDWFNEKVGKTFTTHTPEYISNFYISSPMPQITSDFYDNIKNITDADTSTVEFSFTNSISTSNLETSESTQYEKPTTLYRQFECNQQGRFSDYADNNIYFICIKGKSNKFYRYKFQCQLGYYLNKTTVKCMKEPKVSSEFSSLTTTQYDTSTTEQGNTLTQNYYYPTTNTYISVTEVSTLPYTANTNSEVSNNNNYDDQFNLIGKDSNVALTTDKITTSIASNSFTNSISTAYLGITKHTNNIEITQNTDSTYHIDTTKKPSEFRCSQEGRFSDYFDNNVYFICVKAMQNKFYRYKFQCQPGYYLDKNSVQCLNKIQETSPSMFLLQETSTESITNTKSYKNDPRNEHTQTNIQTDKITVATTPSTDLNIFTNSISTAYLGHSKSTVDLKTATNIFTTQSNEFLCTKAGRFSDQFNSDVYYICMKGKKHFYRYKFKCQLGYYLDKNIVRCINTLFKPENFTSKPIGFINEVSTTTYDSTNKDNNNNMATDFNEDNNSKTFNCLNRERGSYSDSNDCSKFYSCINGNTPVTHFCPNNTVFSEFKKQCTNNLSHCVRNNEFQCSTEGRFSDYLKDNVYYICVMGKHNKYHRFKFQCQLGYLLDKNSVKCEVKTVVEDNKSTSLEKSNSERSESEDDEENNLFQCENEGNYPHPGDCTKYYNCQKSMSVLRRIIMTCNPGEVFHRGQEKCIESGSYECDDE